MRDERRLEELLAKLAERPESRAARTIASDQLFAGAREVRIVHAGEVYRLQVTSRGRLILVK